MIKKLLVLFAVLLLPMAFSVPANATVSAGTSERYPEATTPGTVTAQAGNVTQVNVSSVQVTGKWVGFWGEVSGQIVLGDSSGNIFYQWTISDPTGAVVYVCNDTVSDWSTLQPLYANSSVLPDFLITGTDSFNNTFKYQETFTSPSMTINNVNYTLTWQNGAEGSDFKTYALYANESATTGKIILVWAGLVNANKPSFKGGTITADYQVLAGVNTEGGQQTFYFYLELP